MTPTEVKIVADNIDDFIEVLNGIERLRKAVLTLATSGSLVSQIASEGTAEELYKTIQAKQKKNLEEQKKKMSDSVPLAAEEIPFEIPKSWKWTRLNEIGKIIGGGTPSTSKGGYFTESADAGSVPWLSPADMRKQESIYVSRGRQNLTMEGYKNSSATLMPAGSVIFSSRAPIGYVGIAINPLSTNQGFKSFVPAEGVCSEYVYWYLRLRADDINIRAPGTTFKEISGASFAKEVIALPPLSEQKRIVKKVEEVMRRLDELQSKKRERDEVRARLTRSVMQSLGKGESKIAFERLAELIRTPADLKELEGALLSLAVSGKLLSQNKKDGAVEKATATVEYGKEFNIPKSWAWFQLNNVCTFKYGYTDSAKETGTARFVRITDMSSDGNLIPNDRRYVDLSPESKKYLLRDGDLLTARIGATFGRTILFRAKYKAVFASYLIRMDFEKNFILPEYYLVFSKSGLYWSQAHSLVSGSAQPQFNANLIKKIYLPVPPLAEQKRIVKKVEEVMVLINKLKSLVVEG